MEIEILSRFTTLGHPQRMAVLRLLMRRYPDRLRAGDVAQALGVKPSTLSVYLSALRDAGLITQQRQGTSMLYQADVTGVQQIVDYLFLDCCRGRADLCLPDSAAKGAKMTAGRYNVLFICVGNSARSIMAEALLTRHGGHRFRAYSAGTHVQGGVNPVALKVLDNAGYDTADLRAKPLAELQAEGAPKMDFVFTVCDAAANEDCPAWPGQPISAHWGMPDPAKKQGLEGQKRMAMMAAYNTLKHRISAFAALPVSQLDRMSLQRAVDDIGQTDWELA